MQASHFGEPFTFQAHSTYILKCKLSPDVRYDAYDVWCIRSYVGLRSYKA